MPQAATCRGSWSTWGIALVILAASAATPTSAHDLEFSPEKKAVVAAFVAMLTKSSLPEEVTIDTVTRAAESFSSFTDDELLHLDDNAPPAGRNPPVQRALTRVGRTLASLRSWARELKGGARVALGLSSDRKSDWMEALLQLSHEEFGDGLLTAVTNLSLDPRPEVRYGSGVVAKAVASFLGTNERLDAIACNLLRDQDPNVAALFGERHAYDFRSVTVLDEMFRRLKDTRRAAPEPESPWAEVRGTVSEAMLCGLAANLSAGRKEFLPPTLAPPDGETPTQEAWSEWWSRSRKTWSFEPDGGRWATAIDQTIRLKVGETVSLPLAPPASPMAFTLESYSEEVVAGEPRIWQVMALDRSPDAPGGRTKWGDKIAAWGWHSKGSSKEDRWEAALVPLGDDGVVRVRLRLWRRR